MKIKSLGYIGLGSSNPDAWLTFGTEVLGMMPSRAIPGEGWGGPGEIRSTNGKPGHRAQWHKSISDGRATVADRSPPDRWVSPICCIWGSNWAGPLELEAGIAELREAGIAVREGSPDDAFVRAVTGIAYCEDPSGNPIELYYGPTTDYKFTFAYSRTGICGRASRDRPFQSLREQSAGLFRFLYAAPGVQTV